MDKKDEIEGSSSHYGEEEEEVKYEVDDDVNYEVEEDAPASREFSAPENHDDEEEDEVDEEEDDDDETDADAEVPLFANRENRQLHRDIIEMDKKLADIEEQVQEDEERKKAMQEHLKSVEQEFRHAQQLLEAKIRELKSEQHMRQLAERDAGRIKHEINKCEGQKEEIISQLSAVQNEIFKENDLMDQYKVNMNFNQEELEQWTLAMNQNADDKQAFEKYMKADDAKAKELNFQIEKLTMKLQEVKKDLDEEVTETQAKQIELDKTAEEFRARHKERQEVIRQWQDAIAQVKTRDEDIQKAGEMYARVKEAVKLARKDLDSEKVRLEHLRQDCMEIESKSKMVDRVLQKKRKEEVDAKQRVENFAAEVDLLKTEVGKASNEVQQERQKVVNAKLAIEEGKARLEAAREKYQDSKGILEQAKGENSTAELSAAAAEEQLKHRDLELKQIEGKLSQIKDSIFKESEALYQFRQTEANLLAEISGAQATSKNLSHEIQKLDDESLRQKELVYTAEFQIQQLERKVARANGVRSDDEKKVLNKRIAQCQEELEAAQSQHSMLVNQVKNLESELRTTKRNAEKTKEQRKELAGRIDELQMENNSAESSLQGVMKEKEEVMVSHDLMKLQVKELRDQLSERADKVFGLENRKFQLEMSMMERKKEIQVHSEMQRARAKVAEEERHRIAMESKDCKMRVKKLEKKYATICKNGPVGDDGEERTQAYYVIAAAQKREELQREGDELDAKIRKATREVKALEETLKNINQLNSQFRTNAHRADPKSSEAQELKRIFRETKATRDTAFKKKKELQRLINDLSEDERRIRQLNEQARLAEENRKHLEKTQDQVTLELSEQEEQMNRAQSKLREHALHHREMLNIPQDKESVFETLFQIDINHQTRDSVLFTLGQLAKEFPEMEDDVYSNLSRFGLTIPSAPPRNPNSNNNNNPILS